jgi:hypothetical protein
MATVFSICSAVGANTGGIDCDVTKRLPVQIIVGSAIFSPADYATSVNFESTFLSKLKKPAGSSDKLFPFPVIQGNTAKTTAPKFGTLGYGLEVKLLRSKAGYEFDVLAGSQLEKKLIKFDGLIVPLFIMDSASNMWGVIDSKLNFKGAKYLVGVEPKDFEDAQNAKVTKVTISIIDSRDFVENSEYAATSFNAADIVGLNDGEIFVAAPAAANVNTLGVKIRTAALLTVLNVFDSYPNELAVGTLWSAKTGVGFATPLAITSVAKDLVNKAWTVTLDSAAFTALASGTQIKVSLADATTLDGAGVYGIEIASLIITKP